MILVLGLLSVGELGTGAGDDERFTDEELARIVKSFSVGKTPGRDEDPNLALKVTIADDITLEVYGESIEGVELTAAHSIVVVEEWMSSRKLELAHHKNE